MSPAKTAPRLTPIFTGSGPPASMISRSASSMRPSSSSEAIGRAGGQQQLASVRVHVRAEQAHAVRRGRGGGPPDEIVERVRDGLRTGSRQQVLDASEAEERDRDEPVLRCAGAVLQMRSEQGRERRLQAMARRTPDSLGRRIAGGGRRAREQPPRAGRGPGTRGRQAGRRVVADDDLTGRGSSAPSSRPALRPGPATSSSRWSPRVTKNAHSPLWTPTDMRSLTRTPPSSSRPASRSVLRIPGRRPARALRVAVAVEQEQQRVAAELQQAAAALVRDPQQGS